MTDDDVFAVVSKALYCPRLKKTPIRIEGDFDCWVWTAATTGGGYGTMWSTAAGRSVGPHRLAYEAVAGPIPKGMVTDHLCLNTLCCNPAHLEIVTPVESSWRRARGKLACPQGHSLIDPENVYRWGSRRICRTCTRQRARAYYLRTGRTRQQAYHEENRERILEKQRAYREQNREAIREKKRAYREKNREAIREKARAYREQNRERILERERAYREKNQEAYRGYRRAYLARQAEARVG